MLPAALSIVMDMFEEGAQRNKALGIWAGLASGLLNTSQQLGGAIGIAIASSVAASHSQSLLHAGDAGPAALTGGFQQALWVLGGIALLAVSAIFVLVCRDELSDAVTKTTIREPQPVLAGAN